MWQLFETILKLKRYVLLAISSFVTTFFLGLKRSDLERETPEDYNLLMQLCDHIDDAERYIEDTTKITKCSSRAFISKNTA